MCGVAGYFDTQACGADDVALLEAMNAAQFHRGPDEGDIYVDRGVGLAHRRLSIIDLSSGQQPMFSDDGQLCVVYNGEIYNFAEIAERLRERGHRFRTHCDTEVILYAWREWGEQCVVHFRGMFAFALYDKGADCLFLARDRLGIKPLYYTVLPNGRLLFGSELKAILSSTDLPRELRHDALADYLTLGYVPDPKTILHNVYKLAPGHVLRLRRDSSPGAPRCYWDVPLADAVEEPDARSRAELEEELREQLSEAVRVRLLAEVPLGAFLSGGVDSSAVVAAMAGLQDDPVNTCAIGFDAAAFDETSYAADIARRYGTSHHVEQVRADDFSLLGAMANAYDEPFADASALPTFRVCEVAKRRVTVALSGDGGDEVFAGYRRQRMHMNEERVRRRIPQALRSPVFGALGRAYPKLDWAPQALRAKSTFQALARDSAGAYFHSVAISAPDQVTAIFSQDTREILSDYDSSDLFREIAAGSEVSNPLALIQYLDMKTWLPGDILTKVDRASMANSLEVRVPILDHKFIEWSCTVPRQNLIEKGQGKAVFKRALKPLLPSDILYRPKMGFSVPLAEWLRGPLRGPLLDALGPQGLGGIGLFDNNKLVSMERENASGYRDHSRMLWSLLMLNASIKRIFGASPVI